MNVSPGTASVSTASMSRQDTGLRCGGVQSVLLPVLGRQEADGRRGDRRRPPGPPVGTGADIRARHPLTARILISRAVRYRLTALLASFSWSVSRSTRPSCREGGPNAPRPVSLGVPACPPAEGCRRRDRCFRSMRMSFLTSSRTLPVPNRPCPRQDRPSRSAGTGRPGSGRRLGDRGGAP